MPEGETPNLAIVNGDSMKVHGCPPRLPEVSIDGHHIPRVRHSLPSGKRRRSMQRRLHRIVRLQAHDVALARTPGRMWRPPEDTTSVPPVASAPNASATQTTVPKLWHIDYNPQLIIRGHDEETWMTIGCTLPTSAMPVAYKFDHDA